MKSLLSLSFFLISILPCAWAQKMIAPSNTWSFNAIDTMILDTDYHLNGFNWSYTIDSAIVWLDGQKYHPLLFSETELIDLEDCQSEYFSPTSYLLREDTTGKVYIRDSFTNEQLIYDFGLAVNDIFVNEVTNETMMLMAKDSFELIDGIKRERFTFDSGEFWVKGIGEIMKSRFFNLTVLDMWLLCYANNCSVTYRSEGYSDCVYYFVSTNDIEDQGFKIEIYPNPTREYLQIQLAQRVATPLELFDLQGRLRKTKMIPPQTNVIRLELDELPKGMYILRLGKSTARVVKL